MPPLMGLDLSNTASGRTYRTSSPEAWVQLVTQAPYRYTWGGGGEGGQHGVGLASIL
jgi:hypothetical protein